MVTLEEGEGEGRMLYKVFTVLDSNGALGLYIFVRGRGANSRESGF